MLTTQALILTLALFGDDQKVLEVRTKLPDFAYVLGPDDELTIRVNELEDFADKRVRIDSNGSIDLPIAGRVHAAGMSPTELAAQIAVRLQGTLKHPEVSLNVTEYHSQPVSVFGSVNQPGVQNLKGPKRLLEVVAAAGGARPDAGDVLTITRETAWGALPLHGARTDSTGNFSVAHLSLADLTGGQHLENNVYMRPHDSISIQRADIVYVLGEVKRSGGFPVIANEKITALQAVALAQGLEHTAKAKDARILRKAPEGGKRTEIPVNLSKIMSAQMADVELLPDDILFIPNNLPRSVALRTAEVAIQVGTGIVIWRR